MPTAAPRGGAGNSMYLNGTQEEDVHWNGMGWMMGWGWIFMVLVVVGIVLLIVVLVRLLGRGGEQAPHTGGQRSRARETLDERYARGEIDATEYDERRRRLDGGDGG